MTPPDDDRAVRYLLDELPAAEREAFEEAYFDDEGTYGELLAAEDDLIDRYCEGSLGPEQRSRFERKYLATEEGRERVEFARALSRWREGRPVKRPRAPAAPRWLPWAAALVAAAALLIMGALQSVDARRARAERAALQEQLSHQQQRARDQDRRLAETGRELRRLQDHARTLGELLSVDPSAGLRLASVALSGGLRRDAGALPRLALTPDVSVARLELRVEGTPRAAYRASLQTAEGRELWARDGLLPARADGRSTVVFTVPAATLSPGHYVVLLSRAGGRRESDAEYVFQATRASSPSR